MAKEIKTDLESSYNTLAALKKLATISMADKGKKEKGKTKEQDLRPVSLDEFTEHIKETLPKPKKKQK